MKFNKNSLKIGDILIIDENSSMRNNEKNMKEYFSFPWKPVIVQDVITSGGYITVFSDKKNKNVDLYPNRFKYYTQNIFTEDFLID